MSNSQHFKTQAAAAAHKVYKFGQWVLFKPPTQAPRTLVLTKPYMIVGSTLSMLKVVPASTPSHLIASHMTMVDKKRVLFLSDDLQKLEKFYKYATQLSNDQEVALRKMNEVFAGIREQFMNAIIEEIKDVTQPATPEVLVG